MTQTTQFSSLVRWTGNRGQGTRTYRAYDRKWQIAIPGKPVIDCSNDPGLGGDPALHNPEDLLISALSACHMLWYLHLCSTRSIVVTAYEDQPIGYGEVAQSGAGRFTEAVLHPVATISADSDPALALALHDEIHSFCFIARSVNFPVRYKPRIVQSED